jgi:predicted DNA-binding protein (MmcQ/YjbR family)
MHIEQLRAYCLQLPGVEEAFPFGPDTMVFKVRNKIFLLAGLDNYPLQFNVKCDPDLAMELRELHPEQVLPGYHMNKKHWNTVIVDGHIPDKQLREFIDHSYELVSGKK